MTRAELLEKVLSGWFAIVGEFRGWNASSNCRSRLRCGPARSCPVGRYGNFSKRRPTGGLMIAYVIKQKGARTYDARIRLGDAAQ